MADPLENYQQNLSALIAAREAAGGRITPFEENARMGELDNLWMRLNPDQRQTVVQIWGMESPHKPNLKPNPVAVVQPVQLPPGVAVGGPQNASFIPSIPAAPTTGMPPYVGQPASAFTPQPVPAPAAMPSTAALGPIPPPIAMPGLAPVVPPPVAAAPPVPPPAVPLPPRYTSDQLEEFRRVHQPTLLGQAFLTCSELQITYQPNPTNPREQQMAMLCDDLDLPMVLTIGVDVADVRYWRPFLPQEPTGPFTELVFPSGQNLYLVGSVDYFAMMIQRVRARGDDKAIVKDIIKHQEVMIAGLTEKLVELVPSEAQQLRDAFREHTERVVAALTGEHPKAADTEPPAAPATDDLGSTQPPETPRTDDRPSAKRGKTTGSPT